MADSAFGFRPVRSMGTYNGQVVSAVVPATDSTALFIGDFVSLSAGQDTTDNMPLVTQAAAGGIIYGAVVGFEPDYTDLQSKYRLASTKRIARIAPALPGTVFECQANAAMAAGDVGGNVEIVVGSGDTATGRSGMEADLSTAPITGTAQLQIISPSKTVGETFDTAAAGTNLLVLVNESYFTLATGVA
jgi:hypothetical protein